MHFFDAIFLVLIILFTAIGLKRGFVRELFRLLAMVGGFICATVFYRAAAGHLGFLKVSGGVKVIISFVAVYVVVAVALQTVGYLLSKIARLIMLGWLDRLLGAVIGALKGLLLAWIAVLIIAVIPLKDVRRRFATSHVYILLVNMPVKLQPPAGKLPAPLKALSDKETAGLLDKTKKRLETFQDKVDSAKAVRDKEPL